MRKRRVAKWIGVLLCTAIFTLAVLSMFYGIDVSEGLEVSPASVGISSDVLSHPFKLSVWRYSSDLPVSRRLDSAFDLPWVSKWPNTGFAARAFPSRVGTYVVIIPLWLPLLITAILTGYLWWSDRRRHRLGLCQSCGYDLTGNVSGRCPECGAPT